jgi:hypothetical protein
LPPANGKQARMAEEIYPILLSNLKEARTH